MTNRAIFSAVSATLFTAALLTITIAIFGVPLEDLSHPALFALCMCAAAPFFFFWVWRQHRLEKTNARLRRLAYQDPLLNCMNRRGFTLAIEHALKATCQNHPGALLVIDADNFKRVNDSFGHLEGDNALHIIANIIRSSVRTTDLFGRIGGEEFAVFLAGADAERARTIASRIRETVATASFVPEGTVYPLSVSIGGAVAHAPTKFDVLFAAADKHLFAAKKLGRNRVAFTSNPPTPKPQSDAAA